MQNHTNDVPELTFVLVCHVQNVYDNSANVDQFSKVSHKKEGGRDRGY